MKYIQGMIPRHYLAEEKYIREYLRAYADVYFRDEVQMKV